jgi:hypothetical protein
MGQNLREAAKNKRPKIARWVVKESKIECDRIYKDIKKGQKSIKIAFKHAQTNFSQKRMIDLYPFKNPFILK